MSVVSYGNTPQLAHVNDREDCSVVCSLLSADLGCHCISL